MPAASQLLLRVCRCHSFPLESHLHTSASVGVSKQRFWPLHWPSLLRKQLALFLSTNPQGHHHHCRCASTPSRAATSRGLSRPPTPSPRDSLARNGSWSRSLERCSTVHWRASQWRRWALRLRRSHLDGKPMCKLQAPPAALLLPCSATHNKYHVLARSSQYATPD